MKENNENWIMCQVVAWYDWSKRTLLVIGAFAVLSFVFRNTDAIMSLRYKDAPIQAEKGER